MILNLEMPTVIRRLVYHIVMNDDVSSANIFRVCVAIDCRWTDPGSSATCGS